jgi:hypothetical protein
MIKGTKAETVIKILSKTPLKQRKRVKEVTLDIAGNMGLIYSIHLGFRDASFFLARL